MTMLVVAGLAVRDGKVLMGLRKRSTRRPLMWEHPGGKVDPTDSSAWAALEREWKEELGIDVKAGRLIGIADFRLENNFTIELYEVTIPPGVEPQLIDHEELQWVDPLHAIQWMPCAPGTYSLHADVVRFLASVLSG